MARIAAAPAAAARLAAAAALRPSLATAGRFEVCCPLRNCPYVDSVRENAELVCTLHREITAGLIDELAPDARLSRWEPRDPEEAGCIAEVAGTPWNREDIGYFVPAPGGPSPCQ